MAKEAVSAPDYWPLFPDDIYEATCFKYDHNLRYGKTFLHFRIIEFGQYFGQEVFMALNRPNGKRVAQGSKYFKYWVMVNGWRKPSRNSKMSPRIFVDKVYKVKTRTVKPTMPNGKEMPQELWYSVVDTIEEVVRG